MKEHCFPTKSLVIITIVTYYLYMDHNNARHNE